MAEDVILIAPEDNNTFVISGVPGRGTAGTDGADGTDGVDGATWLSGADAPAGGLGEIGDFYLRSTGEYYKKTGVSTWASQGSLVGPAGSDGADGADGADGVTGSIWFVGAGAPDNGTGVVNDLYLRTSNGDVYQKTGPATWAVVMNVMGPAGADGTDGADGINGTDGTDGTDGVDGSTWHNGTGAPAGGLGVVGDYYIANDTFDYYEKTGASAWTLRGNLKGDTGAVVARDTETYTTASLANLADEDGYIVLSEGYRLMKIQTDRACRVRVYATDAHRTADAARPVGTDPTGDHGLIFEYVAVGAETRILNPFVDGANMEAVPDNDIPLSIENRSGGASTVAVTFTFQITE
jgi:hypothetical protein